MIGVDFTICYNWPLGNDSFGGISIDLESKKNGVKAVILAKKDEKGEAYTLSDFRNKPLPPDEITQIISKSASRGIYLTGGIFIIEIYNNRDECVGKTKVVATKERPKNAQRLTSVDKNYSIEFHNK